MFRLLENINLSHHTTIGLGGFARYFSICSSVKDLTDSLKFARENNLPVYVLGGGSNVIFQDEGFEGLIIKVDLKGVHVSGDEDFVCITCGAGEDWDDIVQFSINNSLGGIECLSGIPGSAGATPIQNVGAYGQEIRSTLKSLKAIDRESFEIAEFSNEECRFSYRQSRFKNEDRDKYIITEITLRLRKNGEPELLYPELINYMEMKFPAGNTQGSSLPDKKLKTVRNAVLELRRKKSMVIDRHDPNSRSCGSFFMNPVLSEKEFLSFKKKTGSGVTGEIPHFITESGIKIPAAWLVEKAGFEKGLRKAGAAISANHTLAIVNCGGTTDEILRLADEIEREVFAKFGIRLQKEPVIVHTSQSN